MFAALRPLIGSICHVYLDDIVIWSQNIDEHRANCRKVLLALRADSLFASAKKTILFADEIRFLGHIISTRGIEADGKKVDRIYWLRRELARMNLEIETGQNDVEKFPFMNSAFIQFNHQVAAHMACQVVNHHVPLNMAPRTVEVNPSDVSWENLSMKWWARYLRTGATILLIVFYVVVIFADFFAPYNPYTSQMNGSLLPPTRIYWQTSEGK